MDQDVYGNPLKEKHFYYNLDPQGDVEGLFFVKKVDLLGRNDVMNEKGEKVLSTSFIELYYASETILNARLEKLTNNQISLEKRIKNIEEFRKLKEGGENKVRNGGN